MTDYLLSLQPFLNFRKKGISLLQSQPTYEKCRHLHSEYFLYVFDPCKDGRLFLYPISDFKWYIHHNKTFLRPQSKKDLILFQGQGHEFQEFVKSTKPHLIGFRSLYYERFLLMGYMYGLTTEGLLLLKDYLDQGVYGSKIFPYPFDHQGAKPYYFPYLSFIDLQKNMRPDTTLEELALYLVDDLRRGPTVQEPFQTMEIYFKILEYRNKYYKDRLLFESSVYNVFGKTNREIISEVVMKGLDKK